MKRRICLLLVLLLTGCTAAVPEGETAAEAPAASEETAESPSAEESATPGEPALPENAAEGTVVEYTKDLLATVDGDRTLTLRLHCRAEASGYGTWSCGINAIEVLEGDRLLQTLSVLEAMEAARLQSWEQEAAEGVTYFQELLAQGEKPEPLDKEGWTHCYEDLYLPDIGDLNFDGFDDIRLMEGLGTVNGSYLHWLWDPQAGQFYFAFSLCGYDFQIDEESRQLVTESRNGWGIYDTDYYQYDEDGVLHHVKNVETTPPDWENAREGDCVTTVHEWVNGVWTQTEQTRSKELS